MPGLPPTVYHLAEPCNWSSIQQRGLLTARQLLRTSGYSLAQQRAWQNQHRPPFTTFPDGTLIRDQNPMPPAALERCLVGVTPVQWYHHLNARLFFWCDFERLRRMRNTYHTRPLLLLTLRTEAILAVAQDRVEVTPINTGFALRRAAPRSLATFVPWARWQAEGWASESAAVGTKPRPRTHAPVELVVRDGLPEAMACLQSVQTLPAGERL